MSNLPPNALVGRIDSVSLFGETVNVTPVIKKYKGEPLFISALDIDANGVLKATLDDQGPPASTLVLAAVPTSAYAVITYKGASSQSDRTQSAIAYGSNPLILRATLPGPGPGKWDNAEVVPTLEEWRKPRSGVYRFDFVILSVAGTDGTLWWLPNAVEGQDQPTCAVVPHDPGIGVQGPWGIQTP